MSDPIPTDLPETMRARLRDQTGQAQIDYAGLLLFVAAVGALVIAFAPSFSQKVICGMSKAAETIGLPAFGPCGQGAIQTADGKPPLSKCTLSDHSGEAGASITVFAIKGGGKVKVKREYRADGKTLVTVSGGGSIGIAPEEGGSVEIDTGSGESKGGQEGAKITADLRGEAGATYQFDTPEQANAFMQHVKNKARDTFIDSTIPVWGGIRHLTGQTDGYDFPTPPITYVQGGAGADVSGGGGVVKGGLNGSAIVGAKFNKTDPENPTTTVYFQLNGGGDASAAGVLGIKGDVQGQLAVTLDKDGTPITATVSATGSAQGNAPINLEGGDPKAALSKLKLGTTQGAGGRIEVSGDLDLRDPANRAAFDQFVRNPVAGTVPFAQAFGEKGVFNARAYTTDSSKYGGDVSGGEGPFTFGVDGSYEDASSELQKAWYWSPTSGGVKEWAECSQ